MYILKLCKLAAHSLLIYAWMERELHVIKDIAIENICI